MSDLFFVQYKIPLDILLYKKRAAKDVHTFWFYREEAFTKYL